MTELWNLSINASAIACDPWEKRGLKATKEEEEEEAEGEEEEEEEKEVAIC